MGFVSKITYSAEHINYFPQAEYDNDIKKVGKRKITKGTKERTSTLFTISCVANIFPSFL